MTNMLSKPLKVYLDTSIFNFAISTQDVAAEKELTLKFLEGVKQGKFLGYISVRVIEEILRAPQPKQDNLLKVVADALRERRNAGMYGQISKPQYLSESRTNF